MGIVVLISGVWMVGGSFVMTATGDNLFLSKLVFNVIPFFLGITLLGIGAKLMGWF